MKKMGVQLAAAWVAICFGCCVALATDRVAAGAAAKNDRAERGRYLVQITGCNDCHTAGYMQNEGNVPQENWPKGPYVQFPAP